MNETENGILLENSYIVLEIPTATLEVTITAKVWHEGEVISVTRTMSFDEVKKAFKEAEDGYIPEDAVFALTEKGRKELECMENEAYADIVAETIIQKAEALKTKMEECNV